MRLFGLLLALPAMAAAQTVFRAVALCCGRRKWTGRVRIEFPMAMRTLHAASRFVQDRERELARYDYVAFARGPLVYATGLIDGFKREETLKFGEGGPSMVEVQRPAGMEGPAFELRLGYRSPLLFVPYFEAGGRRSGEWRLTWMQVVK